MNKPLPCNQKWDDMLPTNGGRICYGCGKLVTDFRKFKWFDIEEVHTRNPTPTCGIYDEKQIIYWGREIPNNSFGSSKLFWLSATLLAISQLYSTNVNSQSKPSVPEMSNEQLELSTFSRPIGIKKVVSGTIVKQLTDSTKFPVQDAQIFIQRSGVRFETKTDMFGRFSIDISDKFDLLQSVFPIYISHPDFLLQTVYVNKSELQPLDISLNEVIVASTSVESYITSFYVTATVIRDTNEPLIQKIKKWWKRERHE